MRISDWSSDVCSSDLHAQDPPFAIEVIGICAAEGDRERAVHVANREAEGASLYPVDHDPQLRRVFLPLRPNRSEEHTSELQSLMRISYAVFCLKKKQTGKQ